MTERPITLQIPASSAYLPLARAAVSAVCARVGYSVDTLDDVALAVHEAAGLLLRDASPGAKIHILLTPWADRNLVGVDVDVSTRSASGRTPRPTTFSWTVLASLVNNVSADLTGDTVTLRLRSRQEAVQS